MNKKIGNFIAVGLVSLGLSFGQTGLKICNADSCKDISKVQYRELSTFLAQKIESNTPLEITEYETVIAILDFEAKKVGGLNLGSVSSPEELKAKIVQKLYEN